jgi:hypothetical protein
MERFRRGSSLANAALREVLESNTVVILVDSTKLAAKEGDHPLGSTAPYDATLESMLTVLQRPERQGGRKLLHPIFVFSKFDSVDPKMMKRTGLEATPPAVRKTGARAAYAEILLEHNLPKTMAMIRDREAKGKALAAPAYFFSSVRTEQRAADPHPRVRLRRSDGAGWEPDYSSDEYLSLLECFSKIATTARE